MCVFFFQESGIHQDYEQPPEVPPFIERRHKKPKSTSTATTSYGETFVQLAEAFTSLLNRPRQAGDKEEGNATAREKSTNVSFFLVFIKIKISNSIGLRRINPSETSTGFFGSCSNYNNYYF